MVKKIIPEREYRILFGYITLAKRIFSDGRGQLTRLVISKPKIPKEAKVKK
jgi:hypothetical protein